MTSATITSMPDKATSPYARIVRASKRVRWEIELDVLRGRSLAREHKYLPDGLSLVHTLDFLSAEQKRFASQIQGRSYANIFGLVERFINAKVLELSRHHFLGDQVALEAMVRFSDEELKHQELFRALEVLAARDMPAGYHFMPDPNAVAQVVLEKSTWSVLGLTCFIELFTLAHYRQSIEPDPELSPLWKDVFSYHWKEESQHALIDELEWRREDENLSVEQRDRAVDDLIALVAAVDGIVCDQARSDADYFAASAAGDDLSAEQLEQVHEMFVKAYRFQYLLSGLQMTRFAEILFELINPAQRARIETALATLT